MMNNIILNGVNSNTIQGLIIQELPPISKPAIRTEIEEIDGRDGDVITKLGYAAYDKQLSIGLYGNYDINQVISFFNTSGTVIFSNEPDKYYNYQILNEIDFERLVRFRTAIVTMHVQPFKYSATETPQTLSGTVITGEGTNISLVNTTDSGLFTDLQIKGDTTQQTYTGKNLFDYTKLLQGTWNSATSTTRIVIDCGVFVQGDTVTFSNFSGYRYQFIITNNAPQTSGITNLYNTSYSTNSTYTLTLPSSGHLCIQITKTDGSSNITPSEILPTDFQLETGLNATSYEPYVGGTPSPNPDYPQEVKTVTGDNSITICGKNLFNGTYNKYAYSAGVPYSETSDSNITINSSDSNNINFTLNANSYIYVLTDIIQLNPNTQYTISFTRTDTGGGGSTSNRNRNYIYSVDNNTYSALANTPINSTGNVTITFTTTSSGKVTFAWGSNNGSNGQVIDIKNIMLEQGSTATEYEAYTSQTYPISLGNMELCLINGAEDYIYKNNGTWYKHSVIDKVVLNGSETYTLVNTQDGNPLYRTNAIFSGLTDFTTNYVTNYFTTNTASFSTSTIGSYITSNQFRMRVPSTISNIKTWLSTHNTDVYYVLATPNDTEITDSTLLSQLNALGNATTYLGTTNIIVSGSVLTPILYVETIAVDDPVLKITNSGNTIAKPIMTLYGTGTINLSLNGEQIFVIDLSSENYITIDVANMEAYYNGILKNRLVTGNYENFVLNQGENEITFTGTLYSLTISNYSRWI